MKKTILLYLVMMLGSTIKAQTVTIGTQVWATKNLDVSKFRNGEPIPQAKTEDEWREAANNEQPAWCYYENDPANGTKYGKLYNWYAVNDRRGLAPTGWHIPSDQEWTVLTDYLGGEKVAGDKMKSKSGWYVMVDIPCPNCTSWSEEFRKKAFCNICKDNRIIGKKNVSEGNGSNSCGFSALPVGVRSSFGFFDGIGKSGYWWSSSWDDIDVTWHRFLSYNGGYVYKSHSNLGCGLSVRCLRD